MDYWLDLFTGTTWRQFREAGSTISGHRESRRSIVRRIKRDDILLCYVTGVQRWVGALRVCGPSEDTRLIWSDDTFPVRLEVEPLVLLDPEEGVPMQDLEGQVSFFRDERDRGKYRGFVRSSPALFRERRDGEVILEMLRQAQSAPVARPVDHRKLARKPRYTVRKREGERLVPVTVTVPEPEPDEPPAAPPGVEVTGELRDETPAATTRHTEIQHRILALGAEMGLDVWVARNDRSRTWRGRALGTMPRVLSDLPTQFNEATTRTIELIDVLWLRGNSIVAAFEIECTTTVYSGLLRMSDLLALQPNLDIKLYLVAPDERREKVQQEIRRPTFSLRDRPLHQICGFLAFNNLVRTIEGVRDLNLVASLKPDFLERVAEYFGNTGPQGSE